MSFSYRANGVYMSSQIEQFYDVEKCSKCKNTDEDEISIIKEQIKALEYRLMILENGNTQNTMTQNTMAVPMNGAPASGSTAIPEIIKPEKTKIQSSTK
jgi:hypothetical protein